MMMTLQHVVHQAKILRKSLNRQLKTLRRQAQQGTTPQPQELEPLQPQLAEVLNLEITRAEADSEYKTDVILDGQVVLSQVSVPTLLAVRKQLKRQQKLYRSIQTNQEALQTLQRLDMARMAVEQAIIQANSRIIDKKEVAQPLMNYLFP